MSDFGRLLNAGIDVDGPGGLIQFNNQVLFDQGAISINGRGNIYYLDAANGVDTNTGKTPTSAFLTLAAAYAAMTTNNNDVLFILDQGTDETYTAVLTWAKSHCHVVGLGAPKGGINKGVRLIGNTAGTTGHLRITGNNNTFTGLCFVHLGSATELVNVAITGDGNAFYECQFLNMNSTLTADEAGMLGLQLDGADGISFYRCTIGGTEVERTDGAADLTIGPGTITNLYMEDCTFIADLDANADGDHAFIEQVADADLGDMAYLVRPTFVNAGAAAALPDAMTVGAATAGYWLVRDPLLVYITDICDNEEMVWATHGGMDTTPGQFVGQAINPAV